MVSCSRLLLSMAAMPGCSPHQGSGCCRRGQLPARPHAAQRHISVRDDAEGSFWPPPAEIPAYRFDSTVGSQEVFSRFFGTANPFEAMQGEPPPLPLQPPVQQDARPQQQGFRLQLQTASPCAAGCLASAAGRLLLGGGLAGTWQRAQTPPRNQPWACRRALLPCLACSFVAAVRGHHSPEEAGGGKAARGG
jgi:hypothetical protein